MIFAARQVRLLSRRPSARILFAGASVKPAKEKGPRVVTTHSPPPPQDEIDLA
jgi:hypothetical protein